jgi:hypothetical protein
MSNRGGAGAAALAAGRLAEKYHANGAVFYGPTISIRVFKKIALTNSL